MKSFLFTLSFCFVVGLAFGQSTVDKMIQFKTEEHNFGKVAQNKPVTYVFEFTNPGNKPLIIENATAECGCTQPVFPKAPIMPGKQGKISVTYNAANLGSFTKKVTVKLINVKDTKDLVIKGEVK